MNNEHIIEQILIHIKSRVYQAKMDEDAGEPVSYATRARTAGLVDSLTYFNVSDELTDKLYQAVTLNNVELVVEVLRFWRGEIE